MKKTDEYHNVWLNGDILTWYRKNILFNGKQFNKKKKAIPLKTDSEIRINKFMKKVQRRRNDLLKRVYSLKYEPRWFITLIYPRNTIITPDLVKMNIYTLAKLIRNNFKYSWFIYTIEWKPKAGFHFHLLGRKNSDNPKLTKLIPKWWSKIVNSTKPHLSDVTSIPKTDSRKYKGYITKRSKWKGLSKVIKFLENRFSHGVINKKNLPVSETEAFIVNEKQFALLRAALAADLRQQANNNSCRINEIQMRKVNNSGSGMYVMGKASRTKIDKILNKFARKARKA